MAKSSFLIKDILKKTKDVGSINSKTNSSVLGKFLYFKHQENVGNNEKNTGSGKQTMVVRHKNNGSVVIIKSPGIAASRDKNIVSAVTEHREEENGHEYHESTTVDKTIAKSSSTINKAAPREDTPERDDNALDYSSGSEIQGVKFTKTLLTNSRVADDGTKNYSNSNKYNLSSNNEKQKDGKRNVLCDVLPNPSDTKDSGHLADGDKNVPNTHQALPPLLHSVGHFRPPGQPVLHHRAAVPEFPASVCGIFPGTVTPLTVACITAEPQFPGAELTNPAVREKQGRR